MTANMIDIEDNKDGLLDSAWGNKHSEDYVEKWGELLLHKKTPQWCSLLPSETVLDIGCGSGAAVRAIASKLTTGHVTGIDPTPKMIEIATKLTTINDHNQRVTFLRAGAEQIPLDNESCDLVLAVNTLHHWIDVDAGLDEVLRILKPSGRFVCIDDLWEESIEYSQQAADDKDDSSSKYELKTRSGIVKLLHSKGFANICNDEHHEPDATASIITAYKKT